MNSHERTCFCDIYRVAGNSGRQNYYHFARFVKIILVSMFVGNLISCSAVLRIRYLFFKVTIISLLFQSSGNHRLSGEMNTV